MTTTVRGVQTEPNPAPASAPERDPASYRDSHGYVYFTGDRVFRAVREPGVEDFTFVRSTGLIDRLVARGWLLPESRAEHLEVVPADARVVLEHPKLPFVSYPYEWSFRALQAAAIRHLDIHLEALNHGVTLADASAFNLQFLGPQPVFIDHLSFRRYRKGEFWAGYRQFCEQFLNPLLLESYRGVPFNAWYRGTLEGIRAVDLSRVLGWTWSPNVVKHVHMAVALQKLAEGEQGRRFTRWASRQRVPREAFVSLLRNLRRWIDGLRPRSAAMWTDYADTVDPTYSEDKRRFVAAFVVTTNVRRLWDIGCNSGLYSEEALRSGASLVVGLDIDPGALNAAFLRAEEKNLAFLPLCADPVNPPGNQGWAERERRGLLARGPLHGALALAIVHHLAIGRNVPLDALVPWLFSLAPQGVVEFVPKSDPKVRQLLELREDIFPDYTEETFLAIVRRHGAIIRTQRLRGSERTLVWYSTAV